MACISIIRISHPSGTSHVVIPRDTSFATKSHDQVSIGSVAVPLTPPPVAFLYSHHPHRLPLLWSIKDLLNNPRTPCQFSFEYINNVLCTHVPFHATLHMPDLLFSGSKAIGLILAFFILLSHPTYVINIPEAANPELLAPSVINTS